MTKSTDDDNDGWNDNYDGNFDIMMTEMTKFFCEFE